MKNKVLFIVSFLIIASMMLTACGGGNTAAPVAEEPAAAEEASEASEADAAVEAAAEEAAAAEAAGKTVLNVWSFTNEIQTMAVAFEKYHPDVDVVYTMIPMTNGEYQTKLLATLNTDDVPDVIALEAAFVKEYVESDFLADIGDLQPDIDAAQTYPVVTEVGTADGVLKALSYQATPGALFYRRSLAIEYFGTDDPDAIQELLSDMDKYTEAAGVIKEKSGGDTYMISSNGDFQNLFYANREQPWVVDDTLVVDPMVNKYIEIAKIFRDNDYESRAQQWQEGWFAAMNDTLVDAEGNPKQVFSFFLPTWGLPYVLSPNSTSADGSSSTAGDWAIIPGPMPYQWGGTWVGAMKDSSNLDLAKEFVRFVALDEENLTNWATGVYTNEYLKEIDPNVPDDQAQAAGDFVSSQVVVEKITDSFDDSAMSEFLGGQNSYGGFAAAAPSVSARLMQGSDDAIQRALNDPINSYLAGEITEDEMWSLWKDAVRNEFPDLIIN